MTTVRRSLPTEMDVGGGSKVLENKQGDQVDQVDQVDHLRDLIAFGGVRIPRTQPPD